MQVGLLKRGSLSYNLYIEKIGRFECYVRKKKSKKEEVIIPKGY